jgi:hypothetical protein
MPYSLDKRRSRYLNTSEQSKEKLLEDLTGARRETVLLHLEAKDLARDHRWRESVDTLRRASQTGKSCGIHFPIQNSICARLFEGGFLVEAAQELQGLAEFKDMGQFDRACCRVQTLGMLAEVALSIPLTAGVCSRAIQQVEEEIQSRGCHSWQDNTEYLWARLALLQGRSRAAARHARAGLRLEHDECPTLYSAPSDMYSNLALLLCQGLGDQLKHASSLGQRQALIAQLRVALRNWDRAYCLGKSWFARASWHSFQTLFFLEQEVPQIEEAKTELLASWSAIGQQSLSETPLRAELAERLVLLALRLTDRSLAERGTDALAGASNSESYLVQRSGLMARLALGSVEVTDELADVEAKLALLLI